MGNADGRTIDPPANELVWESWIQHLLTKKFGQTVNAYGRRGQKQKGLDFVLTLESSRVGVQCKHVSRGERLSIKQVVEDFNSCKAIRPAIQRFMLFSSAASDTKTADDLDKLKIAAKSEGIDFDWFLWRDFEEDVRTYDLFDRLRGALNYSSFDIVLRQELIQGVDARFFYDGFPPTWQELANEFDIARDAYLGPNGVRGALLNLVREENAPMRALGIIGAGGVGKTTLLRRAAYDLAAQASVHVLTLKPGWATTASDLQNQLQRACADFDQVVLTIDDIADHLHDGSPLIEVLRAAERLPVVLLYSEHPDRWFKLKRQLPFIDKDRRGKAYFLHRLSDSELESLVDRILQYESAGLIETFAPDFDRKKRLALCNTQADRHLVVAMLQMRHGEEFTSIIEREYHRVPTDSAKLGYALVAYLQGLQLAPPETVLLRAVGGSVSALATSNFFESTAGLFDMQGARVLTRNKFIARAVTKIAMPHPEARKAALEKVFTCVDMKLGEEVDFWLRAFTGENFYRRFVSDLGRDNHRVTSMYARLLEWTGAAGERRPYIKYLHSSLGLAYLSLGYAPLAREAFKCAVNLDDSYEFAHRQMAWLEHNQGNWEEAARSALKAVSLRPENAATQFAAARILTLNKEKWFPKAKQHWLKLIELEPHNNENHENLERYQNYEAQREYLRIQDLDDLLHKLGWTELNPTFNLDKLRFGTEDKYIKRRLKNSLVEMQKHQQGTIEEVEQKIAGFNIKGDQSLRALYLSNIARLHFVFWRQQESQLSENEIEDLFFSALSLNDSDPFTHCWLGTFQKEVRDDFALAESSYRRAIELGKKNKDPRIVDHPLFLNNYGLLILDGVLEKQWHPQRLLHARLLFEQAIEGVPSKAPGFFWPHISFDLCTELLKSHGLLESQRQTASEQPSA